MVDWNKDKSRAARTRRRRPIAERRRSRVAEELEPSLRRARRKRSKLCRACCRRSSAAARPPAPAVRSTSRAEAREGRRCRRRSSSFGRQEEGQPSEEPKADDEASRSAAKRGPAERDQEARQAARRPQDRRLPARGGPGRQQRQSPSSSRSRARTSTPASSSAASCASRRRSPSACKTFFRKNKLPRQGVRLGIANNRIGVRIVRDRGIEDPKQLENAIRFRAQETLPIPLEEAVLDYQMLGERVDEEGVRTGASCSSSPTAT